MKENELEKRFNATKIAFLYSELIKSMKFSIITFLIMSFTGPHLSPFKISHLD